MAFPNVTDYSREQAVKLARDCQDLHMDGNGWSDTGQHFTISRGGYVLEGRHGSLERLRAGDRQMISAHCPGENGRAIGIENEGTYVTDTPPEALLDSLVRLCTTICRQYGLHAHDIFGHWDFRTTLCPGATFYRLFPDLRRRVFAALGTDLAEVPARRWPDLWRFVGSPSVRVAQYLLAHRGYAVTPNSTFDAATVAAVQDWQARNGIPVDVDATLTAPTWETLAPELDKDATGLPVEAVQFILHFKGNAEVAAHRGLRPPDDEGRAGPPAAARAAPQRQGRRRHLVRPRRRGRPPVMRRALTTLARLGHAVRAGRRGCPPYAPVGASPEKCQCRV